MPKNTVRNRMVDKSIVFEYRTFADFDLMKVKVHHLDDKSKLPRFDSTSTQISKLNCSFGDQK